VNRRTARRTLNSYIQKLSEPAFSVFVCFQLLSAESNFLTATRNYSAVAVAATAATGIVVVARGCKGLSIISPSLRKCPVTALRANEETLVHGELQPPRSPIRCPPPRISPRIVATVAASKTGREGELAGENRRYAWTDERRVGRTCINMIHVRRKIHGRLNRFVKDSI